MKSKSYLLKKNNATDDCIKIIQRADDCQSMVKDIKSLEKILKTISEFSRVAESKLDVEKKNTLNVCYMIVKLSNLFDKKISSLKYTVTW